MEMKTCNSCGMPLIGEEAQKAHGDYCQYCGDENGVLKDRETVTMGIAGWLSSWGPKLPQEEYIKRAKSYMQAMPAWAE